MINWRGFIYKILFGGGVIFDLSKWIIFVGLLIVIVNTFSVSIFVVDGQSMEPNYHDKEIVLWNKAVYSKDDPQRLDVVVMQYPGNTKYRYVKRVIGLPSETLSIQGGKVYIDGKVLSERYIPFGYETAPDKTWKLHNDEFFLMGDNRPGSNDSRFFGPVDRRFIEGKSLAIIFPRFRFSESIK
ncbi:MAG: signal peptidase I [Candidatus Berkelbacteria bacterium]